ncbi:hypothetical protein N180_09740 [Pedobacter antarcticus 4BY]|uniref:SusD family protein n=2 Tax=Pedobacter antarcticus TaxID=34086 RepID=A0A081PEJ6_9SPHI|nr:RagB/SusD family nutrient uptake outer membrane protein [Pedobacter antarcticus]KEQ29119.1 hypothetical protein N180_09740 [Pedobacter antarcticus 4BY]SFE94528.1 SusD family protein [Pedobacter antarcticus]
MKRYITHILLFVSIAAVFSCKKYLDVKPDKSQVVPVSLDDCQALLNNAGVLYTLYPSTAEISSDDYYLTSEVWTSLPNYRREPYLWLKNSDVIYTDWAAAYSKVLVCNQILEVLDKIVPTQNEQQQWNRIRGAALLLRSMSFFGLAQVFAQPYEASTARQNYGIPIRLTPNLGEKTDRGTLQDTYDRIVKDMTEAISLLPSKQIVSLADKSISMPAKAAAYAALARVFLVMDNFEQAFINADLSLREKGTLMDYKTINAQPTYPIPRFNVEVLYETGCNALVPITYGIVNPELYNLYESGDLRKTLFFRNKGNDTYQFKGTYIPGTIFNGLATDEMYLIRAECAARAGQVSNALVDLNTLRMSRWDTTYVPLTANDADEVLKMVLTERRRELLFRGLRWMDLRRLNKDSRFAQILTRSLNGQEYTLPPRDLRYTLLVPREVLERVDIPQNPR